MTTTAAFDANDVLGRRLTVGYQTTQLNDLTNIQPYSVYTYIVHL